MARVSGVLLVLVASWHALVWAVSPLLMVGSAETRAWPYAVIVAGFVVSSVVAATSRNEGRRRVACLAVVGLAAVQVALVWVTAVPPLSRRQGAGECLDAVVMALLAAVVIVADRIAVRRRSTIPVLAP